MEDASARPTHNVTAAASSGSPKQQEAPAAAGSPKQQETAMSDKPLPLAAGVPAPVPEAVGGEASSGGGSAATSEAAAAAPLEATAAAAGGEQQQAPSKKAAAPKKRKKMPMIGSRKKRKTAAGGKAAGGKGQKKAGGVDEEAAAGDEGAEEGAGDGTPAAAAAGSSTDLSEKSESSVLKTASGAAAPMDTGAAGAVEVPPVTNISDDVGTKEEAAARVVSTEEVTDRPLVEGGDIPLKGSVEPTPADALVPQAGEHALAKQQLSSAQAKAPPQAQTNEDAAMTDQPKGGEEKMSSISGIAAS